MHEKVAIVTGGNSGIGIWTVIGLARLGFRVVMVSRTQERGDIALPLAKEHAQSDKIDLMLAELGSLKSICAFADSFKRRYDRLDVLVNNAAVMPEHRRVTEDGYEEQFAVNHLAYFALTAHLLDWLKASAPSRIVNVSSQLHASGRIEWDDLQSAHHPQAYNSRQVYCNTKLMNVLFTNELARQLDGSNVTANALHPGVIDTNLSRERRRGGYVTLNPNAEHGAATSLYVATSPALENVTGRYFDNSRERESSAPARDMDAAKRLWKITADLMP
ncbi:MAG: SDR family oxidoreductase [Anaerolineae bacterium]|nr:SDR family oxidoreductase [Anaerolineae bacterium]